MGRVFAAAPRESPQVTRVLTLGEVAKVATDELHTFSDTKPDLIDFGMPALDAAIGGLTPGQGAVLGMAQGVGKSSTILAAAMRAKSPHGLILVEDPETVVGSAILACKTKINSLDIRRKRLSKNDKGVLREALEELNRDNKVRVVCHPGAPLEAILEYVDDLTAAGCRMIVLDYLTKVRGVSDDRRNEVGTVYTKFQSRCFNSNAACLVASQFSRQVDPFKRPRANYLKENGDIENEARVIILGWRSQEDRNLLFYVLDKSTVGGEGLTWSMRRDKSGFLREVDDNWEDLLDG